jgi:hypothetical protein
MTALPATKVARLRLQPLAAVAFAVVVVSAVGTSAANLLVDGGTIQVIVIHGGPEVGGPAPPAACGDLTFAQTIVGTDGDDVIVAQNGGALIFGMGGNDTITGGNGKDCILGGVGNDVIDGSNGQDVLLGGSGDDTIDGGNGKDAIDGGDGVDTCIGNNGGDTLVGCETATSVTDPEAADPLDQRRPSGPEAGAGIEDRDPDGGLRADPASRRAELLTPCPDDADCVIYVVRDGDNLVSIVRFFDVELEATNALNPWLAEAPHLPVGVDLRLPWPGWLPGRPGAATPPATPSIGAPSTATPEPTSDPTPDPTAQPTPEPTSDPTPDPTAEPTPEPPPEATPAPTAEPAPTESAPG